MTSECRLNATEFAIMSDSFYGAPPAPDARNARALLLAVAREMSEFTRYATEAHRTGSATAIGNASRARERVCVELRKLRELEDELPPEFETQFRSVSDQAATLLAENPRDE